jgi:hypothetical protein
MPLRHLILAAPFLVLAGTTLAAQARPAARRVSSSGASVPDTAALHATLRRAQRTIAASFVSGDTTSSSPLWCADYRARDTRGLVGRDSILRQFTPVNRARWVTHRFESVDTAGIVVASVSDTVAVVAGTYEREVAWSGVRWVDRVLVTHEFRRRPAGWCATHGRTATLRPAAPVPGGAP